MGKALDPDGDRLVAPCHDVSVIPYLVGLASEDVLAGRSAVRRIAEVPIAIAPDRRGAVARRLEPLPGDRELSRLLAGMRPGE